MSKSGMQAFESLSVALESSGHVPRVLPVQACPVGSYQDREGHNSTGDLERASVDFILGDF